MFRQTLYATHRLLIYVFLKTIVVYRYVISPFFGNCCRFYPSCSQYAEEAVIRFGFFKGTQLTLWRLLRCHPLHRGGVDLVPSHKHKD